MNEMQAISEQDNGLPIAYKPLSEIERLLNEVGMKTYLSELSKFEVVPCELKPLKYSVFRITKIVYEKEVFFPDKLSMVYSALHNVAENIFLVVQRTQQGSIDFYIGARDRELVNSYNHRYSGTLLKSVINGCMPGVIMDNQGVDNKDELILNEYGQFALTSVSAIGSLKNDDKKTFVQGIEKFIDSASDAGSFTAIFIADSVSSQELVSIRQAYEQIYSNLVPVSETQFTYSQSSAQTVSNSITGSVSAGISESLTHTISEGTSDSESYSYNKTTGKNRGLNLILFSWGKNKSEQEGFSVSESESHNESDATQKGISITQQEGTQSGTSQADTEGCNYQIKWEKKSVKEMMGRMDKQIKRIGKSENYGMWNFAAYFIAPYSTTAIKLADVYKGVVSGKETGLETAAINVWRDEDEDKVKRDEIFQYIRKFKHPILKLPDSNMKVTPGVMVNTEELAINMSFPQKSVSGMTVKEQAPFGRNVPKLTEKEKHIDLGCIEHLDHPEEKNCVKLDIESLAKHTFITGTTGSGKSNTVYHILNCLMDEKIPFLVIESAKGEYKDVFSDKDVRVYGTNPLKTALLKINPFSFPDDIHVLEHIDRIVEIFNVCWPMYAAMPAVLKESIEEAYKSCGWDLINSKNPLNLFPAFEDVLFELKDIINKSEYSADTQGDYKGALETRLRSLTNGIFGQMFVADEIPDEELFSHSTIIDLSRIGSSETKSMIMGLLIMKLNEYRMAENKGMNLPLRHVTVLEEAHNLLQRTSKEQSSESANIAGKSVEMIANSIAEMRTYGEGFIIADQSPAMLDEAAIRNTNTKIIMALPDKNDREFAGKSVGLKEQQIEEITMLQRGVGVVYQNSWQEAVLCRIKKYETPESKYNYESSGEIVNVRVALFKLLIDIYQNNTFETVDNIKKALRHSNICGRMLYRLFSDFEEDIEVADDDEGGKYVCDEDVAKVFAIIMGVDSMLAVQEIKDSNEYNKQLLQLLKNKLNKEELALFSADLLLNMYIQGCEQCSDDMFYQELKKLTYGK